MSRFKSHLYISFDLFQMKLHNSPKNPQAYFKYYLNKEILQTYFKYYLVLIDFKLSS